MNRICLIFLLLLFSCQNTGNEDSNTLAAMVIAASSSGTSPGGVTGNTSIASTNPINGQVLTASTTTISVTFTSAMNVSTVQSAFSLTDGSTNITGTFSWSNGNKTVTFTPTALTAFSIHAVNIGASAKTSAGGSMNAYSFSFRIGPFVQSGGLYWQMGTMATSYTYSAFSTYCTSLGMRPPTISEIAAVASSQQICGVQSVFWSSTVAVATDSFGAPCVPPASTCSTAPGWSAGLFNREIRAGYNNPAGICDATLSNFNGYVSCARNDTDTRLGRCVL